MGRRVKLFVIGALAAFATACGGRDEPGAEGQVEPQPAAPAASAAAPAPAPEPMEAEGGARVVMLGDSLTAGFGLADRQALPARLEARLRAGGRAATVINAGVSGDTTAGGLDRYDFSVRAADPDLLIVALGANDYLSGLDPQRARANLSAIIEAARADGVAVALVGVRPRGPTPDDSRDAAFAAIFPGLAEEYDLPLYPALLEGVRDAPTLLQPDGLHPTAEGVEVIAAPLAAFVEPLLASVGP